MLPLDHVVPYQFKGCEHELEMSIHVGCRKCFVAMGQRGLVHACLFFAVRFAGLGFCPPCRQCSTYSSVRFTDTKRQTTGGAHGFVRESMEVLSLILIHQCFAFASSVVNR